MRIAELLQACGLGSKRDVKKIINSGRVYCDGKVIYDMNKAIDPVWFNITVDGQRIGENLGYEYWLINKPAGYLSANSDKIFPTIIELLPEKVTGIPLAISGRLDRDSVGLVLLTNNGQLHYLLQQDRFSIEKEYAVAVNGWIDEQTVNAFRQGVIIDGDYICKPAKLIIQQQSESSSVAIVTITEGKRHQIKKMFLSCGVKVTYLNRIRIGPLQLSEDLPTGKVRCLKPAEILALKDVLNNYQRS